ncbi:tetratricopeptide repeat protein [bacterium]|nr:tetratricopeptide repeat protein [bacterium]
MIKHRCYAYNTTCHLRQILNATLLVSSWLMLCAFGGQLHTKNEEGNTFFGQDQYEKAEQAYVAATREDPESPELHYNIGNVLYKQQKYDKAFEELNKALSATDNSLRSRAYYNIGNALYKSVDLQNLQSQEEFEKAMQTYQQAINSYTETLKIDPNDLDAKYNIEYIRRMLKELAQKSQQQQQQQQQNQQQQQQQLAGQGQQDEEEQEKQEQEQQQAQQAEQETEEEKEQQQAEKSEEEKEMTPEEAQRILDSLKEEEEKMEHQVQIPEGEYRGNDW